MLLQIDRAHAVSRCQLRNFDRVERARQRQVRGRADMGVDIDDALQFLPIIVELSESKNGRTNQ